MPAKAGESRRVTVREGECKKKKGSAGESGGVRRCARVSTNIDRR